METRVMIQVRSNAALAASSFGSIPSSPFLERLVSAPGVQMDAEFSPVPLPAKGAKSLEAFGSDEATSFIVRGSVDNEHLEKFLLESKDNNNIIGVFSDPIIQPISVCPSRPLGTDMDVENLLFVDELKRKGMDGNGVTVVIVDTGVNLNYLRKKGKTPDFDDILSWGPRPGLPLGDMPVDHGTMCAYDVCIAAPRCTIVDHALLTSRTGGGSAMDGFLSDAVRSYGILLSHMVKAAGPYAGDLVPRTLVVNNSWGMFHPSWDFPVNHPSNYSDNPNHPFNIIVSSLEAAGADILFAAGNCGSECPDSRCLGATNEGIYGANSSPSVTCVAGVVISKERIGYSTKGPGRLTQQKPDISCFTHFAGSGVYAADGGTSAATPVATGVVAALRRIYPSNLLSPGKLRELLQMTAENPNGGFDNAVGYGILDTKKLIAGIEEWINQPASEPVA